jgi:predicted secreted protein with PEFG-CTERM motif
MCAMKTIAIGSFLVLFALVATFSATAPTAFADHAEAHVSIPTGSGVPGCEETNECWIPNEVTVDVGGEVTWSNDDTAAHTVTSGTPSDSDSVGAMFDSSLILGGATFSQTFDEAGSVDYFCIVHPWMQGIVIVQEAGAEEDGGADEIMVEITTGSAGAGEIVTVTVEFTDMDGNAVEHVNYDVMATQDGTTILDETGVHDHDGVMDHTTMEIAMAASDATPIDVQVTFNGFGIDPPFTGPIGDVATKQVVPEFGTIAMMVLAVSIISIIAVTAKIRVIPRL